MQKITPFLWFDKNAKEAMNFYVSIFKNSKILGVSRSKEAGSGSKSGSVVGTFELEGQKFMVINGGSQFAFSPVISFLVSCDSKKEVDELLEKLSRDKKKLEYGLLTDKYGVLWQINTKTIHDS